MALITPTEVISAAFERQIEQAKVKEDTIEAVQIKHILPVLGEDFYDDVVANPGNYGDLIAQIRPALAYFVKLYLLPHLWSEIGTVGIAQIQGRNRNAAGYDQLGEIKQQTIDLAKLYMNKLTKFLDDNSDSYPLYYIGENAGEKIVEAGGIIFKKRLYPFDDDFYCDDDDYTMYL